MLNAFRGKLLHPNADEPQPKGECGRWRMRHVEAANPSLTVGSLNLVPEFSATFETNLMM